MLATASGSEKTLTMDSNKLNKYDVSIGLYDYNFTNYGLNAGLDVPIRRKSKTRPEWPLLTRLPFFDTTLITLHKDLILQPNLGIYYVRRNHTGLFGNMQLIARKTWPGGFYRELGMGLQYMRYIYPATYKAVGNGDFEKIKFPGRSFFAYQFSFAIGLDWLYKNGVPAAVYLKPDFYVIYPFNHSFNIGSSIQIGLRYNLINRLKN